MIPRDYITEWRAHAPWVQDAQVEQDLVICRALVGIFTHPVLQNAFAFRGGTALTEGRVTFNYRFQSEDPTPLPLRLKVEVNTREHFTEYGYESRPFSVSSRWFEGSCNITSYIIDELLGRKLRALYQRRKGRDLFDMATALSQGHADPAHIVAAFARYMAEGNHHVTRAQFEENLLTKIEDNRFLSDLPPLLATGQKWNAAEDAALVMEMLCPLLPGAPRKRKLSGLRGS